MKNLKEIIPGILILVAGILVVLSFKQKPSEQQMTDSGYEIIKKWELPEILNEISGIAYIGDHRIACVQDEDGELFVYNLKSSKVEKSISFAGGGDYEGITLLGEDAYVLRSDGVIFEISDFQDKSPEVKKYLTKTHQLPGINIEGLCADSDNNRLLLAVKERKNSPLYKEIFAFDLNTKDSNENPLYKVALEDGVFEKVKGKKEKRFSPGEIGIHPKTGEHYILDGSKPKLLITAKDGTPKELIMFQSRDFGNPEGLTFSPEGALYISNEAEDEPANILHITLNRTSN
ncbi:SdiA-regulated domain-containing protein [Salinimicrobium marinum]|nr:SdiA-regulated domain-containing protein [Salinimicrobium marinum]